MAIEWSARVANIAVGIDVRHDPISSSTTHVNVYVDVWVRTYAAYSDSQTAQLRGSVAADYGYNLNTPNGTTDVLVATYTIPAQGLSYSGGPSYSFSVSLWGVYNTSNGSPSVSRSWTLPARPASVPGAPAIKSFTNITSSSVSIDWYTPATNGSPIDLWQLQVDNNSNFSSPVYNRQEVNPPDPGGLDRATTYYARVRAHNGVGWGPWSPTKSFKTLATAPDAPTAPTLSNPGPDSIEVSWTAPNSGGASINKYTVQADTSSSFTSPDVSVETTSRSATLTGLDPATTYYIRVRAHNSIGAGAWSPSSSETTISGGWIKKNGTWRRCKVWIKKDGAWRVVKLYKKPSGSWVV